MYRRRRLAVLLLALIVLGALVWAGIVIASGFGGDPDPAEGGAVPSETAASTAPTASEGPAEPEPSPSDPACDAAQVEVTASTDAPAYAPGEKPVLTLTVTNNGDVTCPVNVGTSQMEFLVTSGEDRIFSSADCQEGADDLIRDIPPAGSEAANFTWERIRSAPGCEAVEANPTPGVYNLTVVLGDRTSEESTFELQ